MNEEFYVSIVGEIFDGYTEIDFCDKVMYLKHLCVKDQRYLHVFYENYKRNAIKRGLPLEEEILAEVKKDDLWTDEEDLTIEKLKSEVENLKNTKKATFLHSAQENIQKDINKKESEYLSLLLKRKEIIGKTAEDYASSMSSLEIIRYFVFKDKDLSKHAFNDDEFDQLDDISLLKLRDLQTQVHDRLDELNIQKSVLRPFFSIYLSFCEDAYGFFGKPMIDLSVFQIKLILFGRIFQSIFQYTDDIPDSIRDDPEKLLAFSETKSNSGKGKKGKPFIDENAAGSTVFGGNKEDIDQLSGEVQGVSLTDEIKKAGGKLDMEQMMKLSGQ